jgi:hypothetical protein
MDNQKQQADTPTPGDAPSSESASVEETSHPPELQREESGKRATDEEVDKEDASSEEKIMPGAVAEAGVFTGPRNRILRHKAAKQQTNTQTPGDAPSSAFASVEETCRPPELQGNQRKRRQGRGKRATPSSAFAPAKETTPLPELQGNHRREREQREMIANNDEEEDASSDEETRPGAVAMAGAFTRPTGPSVVNERRGPSARREPSLIIAELAEPYQEDEDLGRRNQEIEKDDEEHQQRNQEHEQAEEEL